MDKLKIKIIAGSTRPARFSEKPAQYLLEELTKIQEIEAELLDLRSYPMPFFNATVPPIRSGGKYEDPGVQEWAHKIKEGDAFVIVTPEYNHGYPAVLKNAIDVIFTEWNYKPVGFISYGGSGGARAIEQLVQVAIEVRLVPISKSINIPMEIYMKAKSEQTNENSQALAELRKGMRGDNIQVFTDELLWMALTLKAGRLLKKG